MKYLLTVILTVLALRFLSGLIKESYARGYQDGAVMVIENLREQQQTAAALKGGAHL